MEFRTPFNFPAFKDKISYDDKILFLGSCFAENISSYFERYKFQVIKNPFGILYHPQAINRIIEIALEENYQPESFTFQLNNIWSNFDAHSNLSHPSKDKHLESLFQAKSKTNEALKTSNFIFISLGTAWTYKHLARNRFVANCHKLPQKYFQKILLDFDSMTSILNKTASNIFKINPNINLIFTLSPVRHLKDGFIENQQSKSILHLAIQDTVKSFQHVSYFPSYELVLDDLRDYRFYNSDFLHPNKLALDYIWEKLQMTFFNENTLKNVALVNKIIKRLAHRHFYPDSHEAQRFDLQTNLLIAEFKQRFPHINF